MFKKLFLISLVLLIAMVAYAETPKTGSYRWSGDQIFDGTVTNNGAASLNAGQTVVGDSVLEAVSVGTSAFAFGTTAHYDDVDVDSLSSLFLDSSSYAGTIGGLENGVTGQFLFMSVTDATETITIENNESTGTQKIMLDGAADVTLNINEGVFLQFNGTAWYEVRR